MKLKVMRGGSWCESLFNGNAAIRVMTDRRFDSINFGLRVVKEKTKS
jgi:formylglycine-generating enzyme required for sulfatase activity